MSDWVNTILMGLFVAVAVLMTFLILLQEGKGGVLAALGGTKAAGVEGVTNPIRRATAWLAGIFFLVAVILGVLHRPEKSVLEFDKDAGTTSAAPITPGTTPATPATPAPVTVPVPAKPVTTPPPAKTETPKTDAPKTEATKTETPTAETPKTEVPKTEEPKTEAPKTEAPKTEAPKAAEPEKKDEAKPENAPKPAEAK
jgi:protein translocase SecG subunit